MKLICVLLLVFANEVSYARIKLLVGDGNQKPFILKNQVGLTQRTLQLFNRLQSKFLFDHSPLPVKRMRVMAKNEEIDLVAYDNPAWGWPKGKLAPSQALLRNQDVFITNKNFQGREVFKRLGEVPIVTVSGFHYRFANYQHGPDIVEKYKMIEAISESNVLNMILLNRAPLGIISTSYLNYTKVFESSSYEQILIGKKEDQSYKRFFNVVAGAKINLEELNAIIDKAIVSGEFEKLFQSFGLKDDFLSRNL
ncbi:hypothetical protein [Pseudobacteriovorax antillogorgiicola]|uniref:Amino acid ABC transporter substrate-binding protein, PAAT family n=1 Tax=Pseudobacteriovorax antillogorgiicola TaxID=1513793 RepID=A0A1Y6CLT5_9BACT|nr:hypothetical protein [Pseudobacteriovorax antillogorgiicola]TCS45462.1 amino acid ABC transporter substrate-binding protein (PAAT family) [Pseudobacteriovorax antillogorgiicola]SMF74741.1 amino acid ABC transporter substrate-binding protein, PAAT family [Pseudobacteriovorax antillogorgiicola]